MVGAAVDLPRASRLLWTHVGGSSEQRTTQSDALFPGVEHRLGDAEVHHHRFTLVHHDVLGLDVAVDDILAVCVVERRRDREGVADRFVDWELILALESLAQRLAFDVRHDVIEKPFDLAGIEERKDVRMIETRDDSDLAEKPLRPDRLGESGVKNFESYDALVFGVLREADGSHPTPTELAVNGIAGSEQLPEALDGEDQAKLPRRGAVERGDPST